MKLSSHLKSFFYTLFHHAQFDRELDEEILSHISRHADDLERSGLPRPEAERRARIAFGSPQKAKESVREQRPGFFLETLASDMRFALRMLRKNPGFTFVAILTLALGIGANTALFAVIDAILLRPLPFHDPDRLVAVRAVDLKDPGGAGDISYPAFLDWRAQSHSFQAMSVYNIMDLTYTGGDQPESLRTAVVSANLFSMLGASPALGRTFVAQEDQPADGNVPVVLSYELWQSLFGGDPNILGRALTLDDEKYSVVGVMPARFEFPVQSDRVELWITIAHDLKGKYAMAAQRGAAYLQVVARLNPGVKIRQAQSDVLLVQQRLNKQYPENRPRGAALSTEADRIVGDMRPVLLILLGAVGFVLLIACANVASLLLARATVRQKEFTVRLALGAGRSAIARQLLVESLLLSLFGGAFGLFLAHWTTRALVSLIPGGLVRTSEVQLDLRVLAFNFLVALATGVLFGLAPAIQASGARLTGELAGDARTSSAGPQSTRLRSALVVAQLAIAFVLLTGSGLLLRSFNRLLHVDPGFRPDHVLTFLLEVPENHHEGQQSIFVDNLLQSLRTLPGVKSASAIFGLPLSDQGVFTSLDVQGRPVPHSQRPAVAFRLISSQYFESMGIPLIEGRTFTPQDEQGGPSRAIVNETFARKMFPNENPLGKQIRPNISFGQSDEAPMREIVGVVGDVRSGGIDSTPAPEVYAPQTPTDFVGQMTIVVRSAVAPDSLVSTMRSLVSSMDKNIPVRNVRTLAEYVSGSIEPQRFETSLLTTFAVLAFLLTAIGLYGVVSYSVVQRTREMGIRIALGAPHQSILLMILRRGTLLTLIGVALGLVSSFFTVNLLRTLLYEIQPFDPATFIAVPALLLAVALLASYMPARRASRVDPIVALRYE
jgi:predicted permease